MTSEHDQLQGLPDDFAQQSLYARLDLSPDATRDEIIRAYRKQALKYHPDKCLNDKAEEWMKSLNEAKEVLLSDLRADYDDKLKEEGHEYVRREPMGYLPEGKKWHYRIICVKSSIIITH